MALRSAFGSEHIRAASLCAPVDALLLDAVSLRVRQLGPLS